MAGKQYDKKKRSWSDYAQRDFYMLPLKPGSVVKGATVLMGITVGVLNREHVPRRTYADEGE